MQKMIFFVLINNNRINVNSLETHVDIVGLETVDWVPGQSSY